MSILEIPEDFLLAKLSSMYQNLEKMALGSNSRTYRAQAPEGREVIIKVQDHCRDESKHLSFLEQDGFVPKVYKVFDFEVKGIKGCIIEMEYIYGQTLYDVITKYVEEGRFDLIFDLCLRVFRIIEKMHNLEIMHGDIHLGNILIQPDGTIKIIDFTDAYEFYDDQERMEDYGYFIDSVEMLLRNLSRSNPDLLKRLRELANAIIAEHMEDDE